MQRPQASNETTRSSLCAASCAAASRPCPHQAANAAHPPPQCTTCTLFVAHRHKIARFFQNLDHRASSNEARWLFKRCGGAARLQ